MDEDLELKLEAEYSRLIDLQEAATVWTPEWTRLSRQIDHIANAIHHIKMYHAY